MYYCIRHTNGMIAKAHTHTYTQTEKNGNSSVQLIAFCCWMLLLLLSLSFLLLLLLSLTKPDSSSFSSGLDYNLSTKFLTIDEDAGTMNIFNHRCIHKDMHTHIQTNTIQTHTHTTHKCTHIMAFESPLIFRIVIK